MKGQKYETVRLIKKAIERNQRFIEVQRHNDNPIVKSMVLCHEGSTQAYENVLSALTRGSLVLLRIAAGE